MTARPAFDPRTLFPDAAAEAAGRALVKSAGQPERSYGLAGRLYLADSGWLLLSVPNALVRGAFGALHEPGAELPLKDGVLNAHITVADPDEVKQMGGPENITERGKQYRFTVNGFQSVEPSGWSEMSRAYFITVDSPDLRKLRVSYGLEPLRKGYNHHITVAVRRKGVLHNNEIAKGEPDEAQKAAADGRSNRLLRQLETLIADAGNLDGIAIRYNDDENRLWLDCMDWGEGKVADKIEAGAKALGLAVERVNEGLAPKGEEWKKLAAGALLRKWAADQNTVVPLRTHRFYADGRLRGLARARLRAAGKLSPDATDDDLRRAADTELVERSRPPRLVRAARRAAGEAKTPARL